MMQAIPSGRRSPRQTNRALKGLGLLTIGLGFIAVASADESESIKLFKATWLKAEQLFTDKDYQQAASSYEKVLQVFPYEPTSQFRLACCHARLGDEEKAIAELKKAIEFGWSDPERLLKTDELKGLRCHDRLTAIVRAAEDCQKETFVIYPGQHVDPSKPAPLLVLLQGLGSGPRTEIPYWKPSADQLNLVVVAPRAVTKVNVMLSGWHRPSARDSTALDYFDLPAASDRIASAIALANHKFTIAPGQVVLAGFSQGGGVALRLFGDHPERYSGVVAVCSLCQSPGRDYWRGAAELGSSRAVVLAGSLDRLLPRSREVNEHLRSAGMATYFEEWKGVGHEYPPDYQERLTKALKFVMSRRKP